MASRCPLCGAPHLGARCAACGSVFPPLPRPQSSELVDRLAGVYGVARVELAGVEIPVEVLGRLAPSFMRQARLLPIRLEGDRIVVAMADPSNIFAIDDVARLTGLKVEVVVASAEDIAAALDARLPRA